MEMKTTAVLCAAVALCAACANRKDPPLIFGAGHVYGVSIGASSTDTGGEFVVGYKGTNVAVIPVSAVQPNGDEELVGAAYGGSYKDSYSVLGQFGGEAGKNKTGANAGLGKFFATGMAAQHLAFGFARKMGMDRGCQLTPSQPAAGSADLTAALAGVMKALQANAKANQRLEQKIAQVGATPRARTDNTAAASKPTPNSGAALVFAQYDYFALAVDGSAADQSIKLTLGFKDRNVAFVPVLGRDSQGNITRLEGDNPDAGQDAYSVLGQFASSNSSDSTDTNSTLNSFFSTGAASETLSKGFKVKLCDEYQAPAAKPASSASKTTGT